MKRIFGVIAGVTMLGSLVACSGDDTDYYRPTSFGENGACYYVDDPDEVRVLQEQGFCDTSWRPMVAPSTWLYMYMPYYSSAEYRDYYVPSHRRSNYIKYTSDFSTKYSTQINSYQSKAQYVNNKGKKVDGSTVPRAEFGGGVRSKGGQGVRVNGTSVKKTAEKKREAVSKNQRNNNPGSSTKNSNKTGKTNSYKPSSNSRGPGSAGRR